MYVSFQVVSPFPPPCPATFSGAGEGRAGGLVGKHCAIPHAPFARVEQWASSHES